MKRLRFAFVAVAAVAALRCGTITHGAMQQLPVTSNPPGATARATCNDGTTVEVTTPGTIPLRRNADGCSVVVSRSGYESQTIMLRRGKSAAMFANVGTSVLTMLGGVLTGAIAGAAVNHGNDSAINTGAVAGGIIGLLLPGWLDARTGAMYTQHPDKIDVTLSPTTTTPSPRR